ALAALAERVLAALARAPEDPLTPGPAPPARPPAVDGWDEATAALGPDELAGLAREAIDAAGSFDLYGYVTSAACELAVVSTAGLEVAQPMTDAAVLALAAAEGASGYAELASRAVAGLDPAAVAREAVAKAER